MEKNVTAFSVFFIIFLVSMSVSEKVWEGEEVKNLFKGMKQKGEELFEDISFDEINEYMRNKLDLLLTYLRDNPDNIKNEDKSSTPRKKDVQNGDIGSETDFKIKDENSIEEDDDDFKEKHKQNTPDKSDMDMDQLNEQSGDGELSKDRIPDVFSKENHNSHEVPSGIEINEGINGAKYSEDKEDDINTDILQTEIKNSVKLTTVQDAVGVNLQGFQASEITKSLPINVEDDEECEKDNVTFVNCDEEGITGKEYTKTKTSTITGNSFAASENVQNLLEDFKVFGDTENYEGETDTDKYLAANKKYQFSNSKMTETPESGEKEYFKTSVTLNVEDSEQELETIFEVLQDMTIDESSGTSIKLESVDSQSINNQILHMKPKESETNYFSEEETENIVEETSKINEEVYEYKRNTYKVFKNPSAHVSSSASNNFVEGVQKYTPDNDDDISKTQRDELTKTIDKSASTSSDTKYDNSESDYKLNNVAGDSTIESSSYYDCEEKPSLMQEEVENTLAKDVMLKIENKILSSMSDIPKTILDTFLNTDRVTEAPDGKFVSNYDPVKVSINEKPRYKDFMNIVQENLIGVGKEFKAISMKNIMIKYISDKLDRLFADNLRTFLKTEANEFVIKSGDKETKDIITSLKKDVFSTLLDAFLLFHEPKIEEDTLLLVESNIGENRLQPMKDTFKYRRDIKDFSVETSESDVVYDTESIKVLYNYKEQKADHSLLPKASDNNAITSSDLLEEQKKNMPLEKLENEDETFYHSSHVSIQDNMDASREQQHNGKKTLQNLSDKLSSLDVSEEAVQSPGDKCTTEAKHIKDDL